MSCLKLREYQKNLLNETRTALANGYNSPCIVAPCGSGKSVIIAEIIKQASLKGNHTLFIVHRQELIQQIENTLKWWGVDLDYVQLGMVQTIVRRLDKTKKPNLIVTDENHHSLAKSYMDIYEHFKDVPRIGFTATPVRLNGGGLGEVNDILIEGPTVDELIAWGNLAPFKYYAPKLVDTSNFRLRAGDFVKKDINEAFTNKIYGDVISHYNKLSKSKKAIVYCSGIKQSKEVAKMFNDNDIPTRHIDGTTKASDRDDAVEQFKNGNIKVICNVDLISEGFDVPDCQTVIMLRPTKSLGLYIQQSMRSMRYKDGKTAVIIDHVGNVDRFNLPNYEREWILDPKPNSNNTETSEFQVKQCPKCFATLPSNYQICECGHEFKEEEKEVEILEDEELVEIKEDEKTAISISTKGLEFNSPDECETVDDLKAYAKARDYKHGWVWYQQKKRGWL